jgi:WD40 repeat protein
MFAHVWGRGCKTRGGQATKAWCLAVAFALVSPQGIAADGKPKLKRTLSGHPSSVVGLAFSPDGNLLAACAMGQVCLWDMTNGRLLQRLSPMKFGALGDEMPEPVLQAAFSPDGKTLVTGDMGGGVCLWDVKTGARRPLAGHKTVMPGGMTVPLAGQVSCVVFSPDGSLIASCCDGGPAAKLWNAKSGALVGELQGGVPGLDWVAFSPDGNLLALCGSSWPGVRIWEVKTRKLLSSMEGFGRCRKTVFSRDGKELLGYCSHGYGVFIWEIQSGKLLKQIGPEEMSRDFCAHFSGDGTLLATRTPNWEAIVWDPRSGQKLFRLPGPQPQMNSLCFSAGSTLLAIGSGAQNIVRVWELPLNDQVADAADDARADGTNSAGPPREGKPTTSEAEPAPKPIDKTDVPPKRAIRTWTSADGKFTVRAQFVKAIAGVVHLRLENGRTVQVSMEKLSEEDRRFLRQ